MTTRSSGRFSGSKYHKPEIDALKRRWATVWDDEEKAKFMEERKAFVNECQQVRTISIGLLRTKCGRSVFQFSRLASEWQTMCKIQRSQEGNKLKTERFEA